MHATRHFHFDFLGADGTCEHNEICTPLQSLLVAAGRTIVLRGAATRSPTLPDNIETMAQLQAYLQRDA